MSDINVQPLVERNRPTDPLAVAQDFVMTKLAEVRTELSSLRRDRDEVIAPRIRDLVQQEKVLVRMARVAGEKVDDAEASG